MKSKYKGIIFDLDGTLIDTLEDLAASVNKALKLRGFPELPAEEYRGKVGWGFNQMALLALPEDKRNKETADLVALDAVKFYEETPLLYSRPYPGINELLSTLKQRKIRMSILTNKPNHAAQMVISGLFPKDLFERVNGHIVGNPRKPDPASVWELLVELDLTPASVIFVGDSEVDMETAVTSGCYALGVSWGYRSRDTIEKAGAKKIIDKPEELLGFF